MLLRLEHLVHAVEQVWVLAEHVACEVRLDARKAVELIEVQKLLLLLFPRWTVLSYLWLGQASEEEMHDFELRY